MGKYSSRQKIEAPVRRGQIHPIMRGIGCILLVIIPILAYGTSVLLVEYGMKNGWPIPPGWLRYPTVHPLLWNLTGLAPILQAYQGTAHLTANIIFTLAISIVAFGVLSILYGFMYKLAGPSQYGPTDVPPIRVKVKRYKR